MFNNYNPNLESRNYVDNVEFTRNDPCIWIVYKPGSSGDLLLSIIDKHYLNTGCEYYGIDNNGRVQIYSTDYELIDVTITNNRSKFKFDDQWFYDLSSGLGNRNLNYSLIDQAIFACHLYKDEDIKLILDTFPQAKILNIYFPNTYSEEIADYLAKTKLSSTKQFLPNIKNNTKLKCNINHSNVLNIAFGSYYSEAGFEMVYQQIVEFLKLPAKLIRYEYIQYYISHQPTEVQKILMEYPYE